MAVTQNYTLESLININVFVDSVSKKLSEEEFEVEAFVMGPAGASVLIKKDRTGFKNLVGMGLESRITMVIHEGQLKVIIDHIWTNKIFAFLLGSITCGSCTPTAVMGFIQQNLVSSKIEQAIRSSL